MKRKFYLLFLLFLCVGKLKAQEEKLLYSTDFQDWGAVSNNTTLPGTKVSKTTDFTMENLDFTFFKVTVNPTKTDVKFGSLIGAAITEKVGDCYIELSPLASITQVVFTHGATGGSRGYGLEKKSSTDADWVAVSTAFADPAGGQTVTVNINEENVALRFTNLNVTNNAYLFDLKIYGNYTPVGTQHALTTSVSIPGAGTITRTPNSTEYTENSTVDLLTTPTFGYKFVKWVDANHADAELSTSNPYTVTMDAAKNIKAVYEAVTTYNFTLNIAGSEWGKVKLTPEPNNGKYEEGTEVTMTVTPNAVTTFSYWEDNSTAPQRTVIINSDVSYTATFDEIPFIVGWDFADQATRQGKAAPYYAESTNTGTISAYEPSGTVVNWLPNAGNFSPAYPNARLWTDDADFLTTRRYFKAQFSTLGYTNIQVKSMMTANYQAYSIQKLQYSLDDITYTDVASVDITTAYNSSTWANLNATLPADAEKQTKIYLKWIGDASSPILGNPTDNDGTAITNVFVYADKEIVNDTDAPLLVSTVPVASSSTATVNGSVVLTFNEKMKAGTGDITLGSKTLTGVFGSKTVTFAYEKLDYNTEYTLTVPAGALTDQFGNAFAGTTLTFKTGVRAEPTKKLFDAVVAKDGSGDYTSVIDAIAGAPSNRTTPWLIYIKNGKYTGHHDIPSTKPFIHLIGQSRDGVIISDNRLSGQKMLADGKTPDTSVPVYHVSLGATMVVNSKDCYFENITFENSFGYENQTGPQALALYTITDRFTMNHCYLRSYQDTYLTAYSSVADRHYIKDTKIEGAVDFIYGGGDVFFDKDTITVTRDAGGYIVAPSHGVGTAWGYVFSDCVINKSVVSSVTTYLGRSWQNAPKTVFINAKLGINTSIYPAGWYYKMGAIPAVFADYNTMDANGNPIDLSQRISDYEYDIKDANNNVTSTVHGTAKSSLTDAEAATYTYENVILRSGDTWDPRLMAEAPNQPVNLQLSATNLTWDAVAYTRLYIVFRNDAVLGFTLNNQFTDATAVPNTSYKYTVQAVGEYGALSKLAAPVEILPLKFLSFKASSSKELAPKVNLTWSTTNEVNTLKFEVERSVDDKTFTKIGTVNSLNTAGIHNYSFVDQNPLEGDSYYRLNQIDLDGKNAYSDLRSINIASGISLVLYPNPVSNELNVNHAKATANANVVLVATNGKKVLSLPIAVSSTNTKIDVGSLAPGAYILVFGNGSEKQVSKFIKK